MISIRDFNTHCAQFITDIDGLDRHYLVAQDNQAVNKLSDEDGTILVAVIPSADRTGTDAASTDIQSTFFFVVTKPATDHTDAEELDEYDTTQQIALALRDKIIAMHEDGCTDFSRLNPASISIEPEYNIFGGFLGWSLALSF